MLGILRMLGRLTSGELGFAFATMDDWAASKKRMLKERMRLKIRVLGADAKRYNVKTFIIKT